jgi:hypothetical protein
MSAKNQVFEALFDARHDATTGNLSQTIVTLDEVADTIRMVAAAENLKLSARNPANFIKDYLRSGRRNDIWPARIRDAGFTARQRTGEGLCFEFVPLREGDLPFPEDFAETGQEPVFTAQTLSLPLTTREIVRVDEQSLAQIVVKLHLLEHFLANSANAIGYGVREITHLQNNVKLRRSEIDALYQAVLKINSEIEIGAVAVEVKMGDPIIAEQIEKQALAILEDSSFAFCIPVILTRTRKGEVIAMQLAPVRRNQINGEGRVDLGGVVYSAKYVFAPELPRL